MAARAAISLLCLLGTVSAQGYNTTSSTGATATTYSDGAMPTIAGVTYDIQTDTSYNGVTINLARKFKRASDAGLSACLSTCSANVACVGTAYDSTDSTCTYYSSIDGGSEYDAPGTDFATVESRVSGGTTSYLNGTTATPTGSVSSTGAMNTTSAGMSSGKPVSTSAYGNATTSLGATTKKPSSTGSKTSSKTGSTTSGTGPSATSTPSSLITIDGVEFLIEIDVTYAGILIDIDIIFAKRATYTLEDCLTTCANDTSCAGTAFDADTGSCAFYSDIVSDTRTQLNGTTFGTVINRPGSTDTTGSSNSTSAESLICPSYNGHVITSEQGVSFSVGCSEVIVGTTFDITTSAKRQADTGLPQTLSNCVDICATSDACLGTSFETATESCTFYSAVKYTVVVDGVDSASRISTGAVVPVTVTSYVPTTVPVTTTVVLGNGVTTVTAGVVTSTVTSLSTGSSTVPGSAAGSGASYTTVTATVFTTTVTSAFADGSGVATSVVPVTTTTYVGAVPSSAAAYASSGAVTTVYVTVGSSGSDSGSDSGSGATVTVTAAAAGAATVTVTSSVSYCPTDVSFTTVYV